MTIEKNEPKKKTTQKRGPRVQREPFGTVVLEKLWEVIGKVFSKGKHCENSILFHKLKKSP